MAARTWPASSLLPAGSATCAGTNVNRRPPPWPTVPSCKIAWRRESSTRRAWPSCSLERVDRNHPPDELRRADALPKVPPSVVNGSSPPDPAACGSGWSRIRPQLDRALHRRASEPDRWASTSQRPADSWPRAPPRLTGEDNGPANTSPGC